MRTTKKVFRNLSKVVLVLSVLLMASCSSDDDGGDVTADASLVLPTALVTSYTGNLVYTPNDGSLPIVNLEGTATLSIVDRAYTITFSDDVPSISGLIFVEGDDGNFASVSTGTSTAGISLDDGDLNFGQTTIGGNVWAFSTN